MSLEECLEEVVRVLADHGLTGIILITVTVPNAGWLVQPQHVCSLCPGVWVRRRRLTVVVDRTRSVLSQQRKGTRATLHEYPNGL